MVSAEKHPNADKLKLCMVDTGDDIVQVVCGAPNARTGMKAVFARPGVVIPVSGEALKISTIRGVESRGMLCSQRELLLSDEHDGIIELSADAVTGEPAAHALHLNDPVIDVSLTPNRGDATGVYGIARDLAAAGLGKLKSGTVAADAGKIQKPEERPSRISARQRKRVPAVRRPSGAQCEERSEPLMGAGAYARHRASSDLGAGRCHQSHFLRPRPAAACVRCGQALGRCDRARWRVTARSLKALDGKDYTLDAEMCVIADEQGGAVPSAASWAARKPAARTRRPTSSSKRRSSIRRVSPRRVASSASCRMRAIASSAASIRNSCVPGMELATKLILEFCGGEASERCHRGQDAGLAADNLRSRGRAWQVWPVSMCPMQEIVRILGVWVSTFVEPRADGTWRRRPGAATFTVLPISSKRSCAFTASTKCLRSRCARPHAVAQPVLTPNRRSAVWCGARWQRAASSETISYSFIARAQAKLFGGGDDARQLENPIASDLDALRPSVLPSLLAAASRNLARSFADFQLSEVGAQFESGMPGAQTNVAAGIRVGSGVRTWTKATHPVDAFDAKADMIALVEAALGAPMTAPIKAGAPHWYHPGRSGTLALGQKVLGYFGELHPSVLAAFDIKAPVAAFEVFLDAIPEPKQKGKARALFAPSPYPAVERDFAFVLDAKVSRRRCRQSRAQRERLLIERVDVFDVYEGKGVPEGKKSLAIAVRLQPREKTLTDTEIDALAQKIVAAVTKATGGTLRT